MKHDLRSYKTEESITNAFLSLLKEETKEKITITAIAKKANIGRKTFYLHYSSVDDIISSWEKKLEQNILLRATAFFNSHRLEESALVFFDLNQTIKENLSFLYLAAQSQFFPQFSLLCKKVISPSCVFFCQKWIPDEIEKQKLLIPFFASAIGDTYALYFKDPSVMSLDELAEAMGQATFKGMSGFLSLRRESGEAQ